MMKLKFMVMDTYDIAQGLLESWGYDKGCLIFFRASSNFIYKFKRDNQIYYLRFAHSEEKSKESIMAELEYLDYLIKKGYPVAAPVPTKNNVLIETFEHASGTYFGVVFTCADGDVYEIDELSFEKFEIWGNALGELHRLSADFLPDNQRRIDWKEQLEYVRGILLEFPEEASALREVDSLEQWLGKLPKTKENYGIIHYDFELDNIFLVNGGERVEVIDFDDCIYHWFIFDIVAALRDLDDLEADTANQSFEAFIRGYRKAMKLEEEYISMLPVFKRYCNLIQFVRLMRSMKDIDMIEQPEWLINLRPRLVKRCEDYRKGFDRVL